MTKNQKRTALVKAFSQLAYQLEHGRRPCFSGGYVVLCYEPVDAFGCVLDEAGLTGYLTGPSTLSWDSAMIQLFGVGYVGIPLSIRTALDELECLSDATKDPYERRRVKFVAKLSQLSQLFQHTPIHRSESAQEIQI